MKDYAQNQEQVKILLVYLDYNEGDTHNKSYGGNYSEGLASISAVLKAGGHDCALFHVLYDMVKSNLKIK